MNGFLAVIVACFPITATILGFVLKHYLDASDRKAEADRAANQAATSKQIVELHVLINSRLDELLVAERSAGRAEGLKEGRDAKTDDVAKVIAAGRTADRADADAAAKRVPPSPAHLP